MGSAIWTGTITFGLVSIPVKLLSVTSPHDISFNLLHKDCKQPIKYQYYCPSCDRLVERSELVRGYQYEKGKYVIIDDEEFESIQPQSRTNLEILQFLKVEEIDPIYFEKTYSLAPADKSTKSFDLFANALKETDRAGIGRLIMRNHEYLVLVRFALGGLMLHLLLYEDEIRKDYYKIHSSKLPGKEAELAKQLIDNLTEPFHPENYRNEYISRLKKILENKAKGRKLILIAPKAKPKTVDLLEALQKSVQQSQKSAARQEGKARKIIRLRKIKSKKAG
jgi:DNA end-binding protein Ku